MSEGTPHNVVCPRNVCAQNFERVVLTKLYVFQRGAVEDEVDPHDGLIQPISISHATQKWLEPLRAPCRYRCPPKCKQSILIVIEGTDGFPLGQKFMDERAANRSARTSDKDSQLFIATNQCCRKGRAFLN